MKRLALSAQRHYSTSSTTTTVLNSALSTLSSSSGNRVVGCTALQQVLSKGMNMKQIFTSTTPIQQRGYHSKDGKRFSIFNGDSSIGKIDSSTIDFSNSVPISLNSTSISHKWNVVEFDDQGNIRMSQIKRSDLYTNY